MLVGILQFRSYLFRLLLQSAITERVQCLNAAKAEFKTTTGQDWNPDLVNKVKAASPESPVKPTPSKSVSGSESLLLQIKELGESVRQMKASGADKVCLY